MNSLTIIFRIQDSGWSTRPIVRHRACALISSEPRHRGEPARREFLVRHSCSIAGFSGKDTHPPTRMLPPFFS